MMAEPVDGLEEGVVGYREVALKRFAFPQPESTKLLDVPASFWAQSLYTVVDDQWAVMLLLNTWGRDDAAEARDFAFKTDLSLVLDATVDAIREHGAEVLNSTDSPSLADAVKYLQGG